MRKLIKKILKEGEWEWANKVEAKLTKGLILCPNHERFSGGCKEVFKVDEVIHQHATDRMVYLKDLENGNRYANTMKDMMQWLSDGDYVISYQPLKESKDFDWIESAGSSKIDKDDNYAIYLGKDLDFSGVDADSLGVDPMSDLRKLNKREMFINVFFNNLEKFGYDISSARTHFNFIKWVYLNGNYYIPKMSLEYDDRYIEDPSWKGEYVVLYNPIDVNHFVQSKVIGESIDDFNWIKDVEVSLPFIDVELNNAYDIHFINPKEFIKQAEQCGVRTRTAEDMVYKTSYIRAREYQEVSSVSIYCDEHRNTHYKGVKPSLLLSFYDDLNRLIISSYWVAEDQEITILPYKKRQR